MEILAPNCNYNPADASPVYINPRKRKGDDGSENKQAKLLKSVEVVKKRQITDTYSEAKAALAEIKAEKVPFSPCPKQMALLQSRHDVRLERAEISYNQALAAYESIK